MMNTVCEKNMCNGCKTCISKCPKHCIMIQDSMEAYNAKINMENCIQCGLCKKICPRNSKILGMRPIEWYQGWAENEIRQNSTSGGIALAVIRTFIEGGGYVASCTFYNGKFGFEITNDIKVAQRFAGSKYVKSDPGNIYKQIEDVLKMGKVLFVGLPCQVAAVKNFFGNHERLYTIDLICHGTPSPEILRIFLKEHRIELKTLENIKFRTKIDMGLSNNGIKISQTDTDDYLLAFLAAIDYTENCYYCDYACLERVSDITLGDSWGTEYLDEEIRGVSLILIQSDKGKELLQQTKLKLHDVDLEQAVRHNQQLQHPSKMTPDRTTFFEMLNSGKSMHEISLKLWTKRCLKRDIKNLMISLHLKKNKWGVMYNTVVFRK